MSEKNIVKLLLKKPSLYPNILKHFRPVSNLSFVSKLLEKIVISLVLAHLDHNNLWHDYQSAYRHHHSAETALLRVFHDLLTAGDTDQISILTLLDLSIGFDTMDHDLFLYRLKHVLGATGVALLFFMSYPVDMELVVSVLGYESLSSSLLYGAPQGSVRSPILFLLYTQPLFDIISRYITCLLLVQSCTGLRFPPILLHYSPTFNPAFAM